METGIFSEVHFAARMLAGNRDARRHPMDYADGSGGVVVGSLAGPFRLDKHLGLRCSQWGKFGGASTWEMQIYKWCWGDSEIKWLGLSTVLLWSPVLLEPVWCMEAGLRLMEERTLGALVHHKGHESEEVRTQGMWMVVPEPKAFGRSICLGQPVRDTAAGALCILGSGCVWIRSGH